MRVAFLQREELKTRGRHSQRHQPRQYGAYGMKKTGAYSTTLYQIHTKKTSCESGKFRAVFLSDMHNACRGEDDSMLMSLIEKQQPDIVLCGGDMLVAYPGKDVSQAAGFMNEAGRRWPTYYALGNHEYRLKLYPETYGDMYDRYMDSLDTDCVHVLDDAAAEVVINRVPLIIYGFSVKRKYYHRFKNIPMPTSELTKVFGSPDKTKVSVLLAHTPKYIRTYFKWGADLTLSGHYHGGIMRFRENKGLISPDLKLFPHNAHGMIKENEKSLIISAGLGEHTVPFRLKNPRELVAIDIICS